MTKKFLIVFHDMGLGGIQKKIIDISKYILQNYPDIEIHLCLRRKIGLFLDDIPPNVKIIAPRRPLYRLGGIRFAFFLIKEIFIFDPTHILTFMDFSAIPTFVSLNFLFWKKPIVTIGEDILTSKYLSDLYDPHQASIKRSLIKKYYPQAHKILLQTPIQKTDMEHILEDPNSPKIIATPNWLPLDYPATFIVKKDIDILFVGRVAAQKNLTKFVNIIKDVVKTKPSLRVVIAGDGEERLKIKQLITRSKLNKNIKMVGLTTTPQKFYLRAKMFLLTSDYEGFPLTLMEAISSDCYPICQNLPELNIFFEKFKNQILFKQPSQAIKLILSSKNPAIINYYQRKLIRLQQKNIKLYIDYCLS
jgi:glycosyltransferase involved in cell wall biosynthesis